MIELEALRVIALRFLSLTDEMLLQARQDSWNDFLLAHEERERQMAVLVSEAGESLLRLLPELKTPWQQALEKTLVIDELARAQRDELGETLSSVQRKRRLRSTYRS
jgi:hypothetical protein